MIVDPGQQEPGVIYRLMTDVIVPRPIAFVSTVDEHGSRNLAPFSFFTAISANPPVVCFAPMRRGRDGGIKDTLRNIESTGEFVVNIVSEDIAERMNACSADVPPEVDEFVESGLGALPSDLIRPPRVMEAPVSMECSVLQVVHVSSRPLGGSLVIGEVLRFHLRDGLAEGLRIDPEKLRAFGRLGGSTYARTSDRFTMERPRAVSAGGR